MFCTIFIPLSVAKILKKNVQISNAQFLYVIFGSSAILGKLRYIIWRWISCGYFLVSSSNILKRTFLGHLRTMASISLIEEDSIATTKDSFKDCIFSCKIRNEMYTNFKKKRFHKQPVVVLFENGCSVRYMFCTIFTPLSVEKILANLIRSSSYLIKVFSSKISVHMENLLNGFFCYSSFTRIFLRKYFSKLVCLAGEREINRISQRKLKPGDRLWVLQIAHWKLCLYWQLFCIR